MSRSTDSSMHCWTNERSKETRCFLFTGAACISVTNAYIVCSPEQLNTRLFHIAECGKVHRSDEISMEKCLEKCIQASTFFMDLCYTVYAGQTAAAAPAFCQPLPVTTRVHCAAEMNPPDFVIRRALLLHTQNDVTAGFPHRPIQQLQSPFFQRVPAAAARSLRGSQAERMP